MRRPVIDYAASLLTIYLPIILHVLRAPECSSVHKMLEVREKYVGKCKHISKMMDKVIVNNTISITAVGDTVIQYDIAKKGYCC